MKKGEIGEIQTKPIIKITLLLLFMLMAPIMGSTNNTMTGIQHENNVVASNINSPNISLKSSATQVQDGSWFNTAWSITKLTGIKGNFSANAINDEYWFFQPSQLSQPIGVWSVTITFPVSGMFMTLDDGNQNYITDSGSQTTSTSQSLSVVVPTNGIFLDITPPYPSSSSVLSYTIDLQLITAASSQIKPVDMQNVNFTTSFSSVSQNQYFVFSSSNAEAWTNFAFTTTANAAFTLGISDSLGSSSYTYTSVGPNNPVANVDIFAGSHLLTIQNNGPDASVVLKVSVFADLFNNYYEPIMLNTTTTQSSIPLSSNYKYYNASLPTGTTNISLTLQSAGTGGINAINASNTVLAFQEFTSATSASISFNLTTPSTEIISIWTGLSSTFSFTMTLNSYNGTSSSNGGNGGSGGSSGTGSTNTTQTGTGSTNTTQTGTGGTNTTQTGGDTNSTQTGTSENSTLVRVNLGAGTYNGAINSSTTFVYSFDTQLFNIPYFTYDSNKYMVFTIQSLTPGLNVDVSLYGKSDRSMYDDISGSMNTVNTNHISQVIKQYEYYYRDRTSYNAYIDTVNVTVTSIDGSSGNFSLQVLPFYQPTISGFVLTGSIFNTVYIDTSSNFKSMNYLTSYNTLFVVKSNQLSALKNLKITENSLAGSFTGTQYANINSTHDYIGGWFQYYEPGRSITLPFGTGTYIDFYVQNVNVPLNVSFEVTDPIPLNTLPSIGGNNTNTGTNMFNGSFGASQKSYLYSYDFKQGDYKLGFFVHPLPKFETGKAWTASNITKPILQMYIMKSTTNGTVQVFNGTTFTDDYAGLVYDLKVQENSTYYILVYYKNLEDVISSYGLQYQYTYKDTGYLNDTALMTMFAITISQKTVTNPFRANATPGFEFVMIIPAFLALIVFTRKRKGKVT